MSFKEQIKQRLKTHYGVDNCNKEDDLSNDLGLDSLDRAELFLWCDNNWSIYINDYDAEDINTLDDLITMIDKKFVCKCITHVARKRCKNECEL